MAFLKTCRHPRTRNSYLGDIRAFYRFCIQFKFRAVNPASDIPRVPVPSLLPRPVTRDRAAKLLMAADAESPRAGMVVALLLYSGLRREEAVTLTWAHVDLDAGELRIEGKGLRQRVVPIHPRLKTRLIRWRETSEDAYLFPGARDGTHLSRTRLWQDVKDAGARAGLEAITPHRLRHTFATEVLENSDIRSVQVLLGHESLTSTQIYTKVANRRLQADVGRLDFSP